MVSFRRSDSRRFHGHEANLVFVIFHKPSTFCEFVNPVFIARESSQRDVQILDPYNTFDHGRRALLRLLRRWLCAPTLHVGIANPHSVFFREFIHEHE